MNTSRVFASKSMQKKIGRPKTTGSGEQVVVRIHGPLLAALDAWCAKQLDSPTRAEALRRLAAQALVADASPKPARRSAKKDKP